MINDEDPPRREELLRMIRETSLDEKYDALSAASDELKAREPQRHAAMVVQMKLIMERGIAELAERMHNDQRVGDDMYAVLRKPFEQLTASDIDACRVYGMYFVFAAQSGLLKKPPE